MNGWCRSLVMLGFGVLTFLLAGDASAQDPNHQCNNLGLPAVCNVSASPANPNTNQPLTVTWTGKSFSRYGIFLCANVGNPSWYCDHTSSIVATLLDWTPVPFTPGPLTHSDSVQVPACVPSGYYRALAMTGNGSAADVNWSNLLYVNQVLPCVTNVVVGPPPMAQGFATTVSWSASSQNGYAIDLLDANGNPVEPITGWVWQGGTRQHTWNVRQTLAAGTYRVRVHVDNGSGVRSSDSAPFNVVATPTVGNVGFQALGSCFTTASTYAGKPVKVTWTSTNQQQWELFRCNGGCVSTGLSGNGSTQETTWTPDASLTGSYSLKIRVTANNFWREAQSTSALELRSRPSVVAQWQYWNTDVPEAAGTTNLMALVTTQPAGARLPDPVSIAYSTENETATAGVDYSRRTSDLHGPIAFAQCQDTGATGVTAPLPTAINIGQDTNYEGNETFAVVLSGASGASVGPLARHTFVILDDDPAPVLSVNDVTLAEPDAGTAAATFTVTLTGGNAQAVTYTVSAGGGTATVGADYDPLSLTDSIPPGSGTRTRTYTVPVKGDLLDEDDETFSLTLSGVQNAQVTDGVGLGTIVDNDPLPVLSLQPVTVPEGSGQALFRAVLTPVSGRWVAGSYGSLDGTASSPSDYEGGAASFQIAPGENGTDIPIAIVGDALHEANETFSLHLASPYNAAVSDTNGSAVGTITDDDEAPRVTITDASTDEPWSGSQAGEWLLELSAESGLPVSVPFTTAGCTATAGTDYTASASGTVTFAAGETSRSLPFDVLGETTVEGHEFFVARLGTPTGASLADDTGQSVILDNQAPVLAIVRSDFDGDGDNDVVWFDAGTGSYGVWFLKGLRRADAATFDPPAPAAAGWTLANVADLNGDNHPDLLWRNETSGRLVMWFMNGVTRTSSAIVDPVVDPTWTLVGTARMDANASPDLLWRNPATGELWVWLMDGATRQEQRALTPAVPAGGWIPQFLGDLNADGGADLVLRNQTSGAIVAWLLNGTVRTEGRPVTGLAMDQRWDPIGAFDADVDGTTDFAWQNRDDGRVYVVLMSGTVPRCGVFLVPEDAESLGRRAFGPR